MLTLEKLRIYQKFRGNLDDFGRGATKAERRQLSDEEWGQIELLLHKVGNLKAGLVSEEFENRIREELKREVEDEEARRFLWELA